MLGEVFVVNVKGLGVNEKVDVVYCGRKSGGWSGSVLSNKFRIGVDGDRSEVIEKYRVWLFEEYKNFGDVYCELKVLEWELISGKDVFLGCWCKPLDCHCDVIKGCLEWMIKNVLDSMEG